MTDRAWSLLHQRCQKDETFAELLVIVQWLIVRLSARVWENVRAEEDWGSDEVDWGSDKGHES